jgi:hypothetical protein
MLVDMKLEVVAIPVTDVGRAKNFYAGSVAHGDHDKRAGHADGNWPDRYATYLVAKQTGAGLPT